MRTKQLRIASAFTALAFLSTMGVATIAAAEPGGASATLTTAVSCESTGDPINVTATYSGDISGLAAGDVSVTNGTVSDFAGSGAVYTFTVTAATSGAVTIQIPADVASTTSNSKGNLASNTLNCSFESAADALAITDVAADAGVTTATVTWTTNVAADSSVEYGTTTSYGLTASSSSSVTSHSVGLSGLDADTTYHFRVSSSNGSSTDMSADMTFTTDDASTSEDVDLAFTGADAIKTTAIANNEYADGWSWNVHFTVPTDEDAFRIRFSDWANGSTTFPADGNMRISSPQSSNATSSATAITIDDNNFSDWLYFTGDIAGATAGRQIDLLVEVKIPFGTAPGAYSTSFTAESWPSSATSTATTTP